MSRYDRQEQMVQIGLEGQAKLGAAHVVVVGAGGLGHPVASYLAGGLALDASLLLIMTLLTYPIYIGKFTSMKRILAG